MNCPKCGAVIGITIARPDYQTAYKKLEEAKETLSRMADTQLKTKLEQQIKQAMENLDGPISIAMRHA
jgi:hypothetical protein